MTFPWVHHLETLMTPISSRHPFYRPSLRTNVFLRVARLALFLGGTSLKIPKRVPGFVFLPPPPPQPHPFLPKPLRFCVCSPKLFPSCQFPYFCDVLFLFQWLVPSSPLPFFLLRFGFCAVVPRGFTCQNPLPMISFFFFRFFFFFGLLFVVFPRFGLVLM